MKKEKNIIGITLIVDLIVVLLCSVFTIFSNGLSSKIYNNIFIGMVSFVLGSYIVMLITLIVDVLNFK